MYKAPDSILWTAAEPSCDFILHLFSPDSRRPAEVCSAPAPPVPPTPQAEDSSVVWEASQAKTPPTKTRLEPQAPAGSDKLIRQVRVHRVRA